MKKKLNESEVKSLITSDSSESIMVIAYRAALSSEAIQQFNQLFSDSSTYPDGNQFKSLFEFLKTNGILGFLSGEGELSGTYREELVKLPDQQRKIITALFEGKNYYDEVVELYIRIAKEYRSQGKYTQEYLMPIFQFTQKSKRVESFVGMSLAQNKIDFDRYKKEITLLAGNNVPCEDPRKVSHYLLKKVFNDERRPDYNVALELSKQYTEGIVTPIDWRNASKILAIGYIKTNNTELKKAIVKQLDKYHQTLSPNIWVIYYLAICYKKEKLYSQAANLLKKIISKVTRASEMLYRIANDMMKLENKSYKEIFNLYEIAAMNGSYKAWIMIGDMKLEGKNSLEGKSDVSATVDAYLKAFDGAYEQLDVTTFLIVEKKISELIDKKQRSAEINKIYEKIDSFNEDKKVIDLYVPLEKTLLPSLKSKFKELEKFAKKGNPLALVLCNLLSNMSQKPEDRISHKRLVLEKLDARKIKYYFLFCNKYNPEAKAFFDYLRTSDRNSFDLFDESQRPLKFTIDFYYGLLTSSEKIIRKLQDRDISHFYKLSEDVLNYSLLTKEQEVLLNKVLPEQKEELVLLDGDNNSGEYPMSSLLPSINQDRLDYVYNLFNDLSHEEQIEFLRMTFNGKTSASHKISISKSMESDPQTKVTIESYSVRFWSPPNRRQASSHFRSDNFLFRSQ